MHNAIEKMLDTNHNPFSAGLGSTSLTDALNPKTLAQSMKVSLSLANQSKNSLSLKHSYSGLELRIDHLGRNSHQQVPVMHK